MAVPRSSSLTPSQMVSPPKPWERNGAAATSSPAMASSASTPIATSSTPASSSSNMPTVPERPAALTHSTAVASPYSAYGTSPYSRAGTSYNSYGGMGTYGSSYGGYGGGMGMGSYGGVGSYGMGSYGGMGYGGGYGGMGTGMGYGGMGMGGMMGPNGMPMDPNNPSLTQALESTTQSTFALLHSIVQTFSGVAQMLESTFMATHSSFFAMAGVADQLGNLRNALGSVLGVFGLLRWLRELITGRPSAPAGMHNEFRDFVNGRPVAGPMGPPPKASKKPLVLFLLAIFGIPYAMTKIIKILQERAHAQAAANGGLLPGQLPPLDPSTLTFARALYPFTPTNQTELGLKESEIVAIMAKLDPRTGMEVDPRMEVEGEWWKGRTRDGREGWFPRKFVEVLERKKPEEPKKVD